MSRLAHPLVALLALTERTKQMRSFVVLASAVVLAGCVPDYGPGYPNAGYYRPPPQAYYQPQPRYAPSGWGGYGYFPQGGAPPQGTRAHERWQRAQGTEVSGGN